MKKWEEKIAEAKRVMQANYDKHYAIAQQERDRRNARYTLHGWLLFLCLVAVLIIVPGNFIVKISIGWFAGCIIWGIQSSKCKKEYEHTYRVTVDTDDEGNIIHADKL